MGVINAVAEFERDLLIERAQAGRGGQWRLSQGQERQRYRPQHIGQCDQRRGRRRGEQGRRLLLCADRGGERDADRCDRVPPRSEEHTSELQSLMRISYAVFCLKKKKISHLIINETTYYEQDRH